VAREDGSWLQRGPYMWSLCSEDSMYSSADVFFPINHIIIITVLAEYMDLRNISKDMIVVVDSRFPCLSLLMVSLPVDSRYSWFRCLILTDVLLQGNLRD
jgi:hypothetical protein